MKRIAVFCGSSTGYDAVYASKAFELGKIMAACNIGVVYGGAKIGLMGAVANGCLEHGGEAIGVIPHFLRTKEVAHDGLTELVVVETMHERKLKMDSLSDAVIALPGGFGTMEEFFEMLTWAQLGLHKKPIGLLNIEGFYSPLLNLAGHMVEKGFLKKVNYDMLLVSDDPRGLLHLMQTYTPPAVQKWITKDKV
jgi:uncharacterized protein (TIGR00730 family)